MTRTTPTAAAQAYKKNVLHTCKENTLYHRAHMLATDSYKSREGVGAGVFQNLGIPQRI